MRIVLITVLMGALLAGCAHSPTIVAPPDRPRLDNPPAELTKDCSWPEMVKVSKLTQEQGEALLRSNARGQIDCYKRFKLLRDFYRKRDGLLRAEGRAK